MRVFKRRWRTDGKLHIGAKWTIAFRDHHGHERRVNAETDKGAAADMGRCFDKLVSYRAARLRPDPELQRWLETLPPGLLEKLNTWDVLTADVGGAGKPLADHLDDFWAWLKAGATAKHADLTRNRIKAILEECGFKRWGDVEGVAVVRYLDGLRKREKIGARSFNAYLQAVKSFAGWMVRERRSSENPLKHLKPINARTDRRHVRRALSSEECRRLLRATGASGETIYGMRGWDRAAVYRVALETGLRWNELRSLTRGDFVLDGPRPRVTVQAAYSKHRREDTLPLRPDTAKALKAYLGASRPSVTAFPMPVSNQGAKMLRADLTAAGIEYEDSAGRVADFHSLRTTFITGLSLGGVHPRTAQALARHSSIELTMGAYTDLTAIDLAGALDGLPDLDTPVDEGMLKTGTDETTDRKLTVGHSQHGRFRPLVAASRECKSEGTKMRRGTQTRGEARTSKPISDGGPSRTRTCDQRIMSPPL